MIAHLQGREQALEPFGWTGRRAKWIALACLHSGVFTRAQWTRFLGCHTKKVRRAVHALIAQGVAAEENVPGITGISRVCRIYGRGIYTGRTRANRRVEGTGSQASWPGADSPRHHLADRAPLRSALPMTDLRLMPPLGCENDVGGRFTVCPVPDSHGTRRVSAEAAVSYASAARPAVARRAAEAEMGATPQSEGLLRARTQVCFHTPAPVPWGRSRSINPYAGRRFERRFEAADHPFADRPAVWQPGITEQGRGTPDGSGHSPSRQVRDAPVPGDRWPSRTGLLDRSDLPTEGGWACTSNPPRCRTRHRKRGVAPVPVSAARAALTDPAAKAQDVAVSWLTP